jgi:hypothetical protein
MPPQLEDLEVTGSDYIKPAPLGNFRAVWEELPPETEREDDYGLGQRNNLQVRAHVCVGKGAWVIWGGGGRSRVRVCSCVVGGGQLQQHATSHASRSRPVPCALSLMTTQAFR